MTKAESGRLGGLAARRIMSAKEASAIGAAGGRARAEAQSPEERSAAASEAASARWAALSPEEKTAATAPALRARWPGRDRKAPHGVAGGAKSPQRRRQRVRRGARKSDESRPSRRLPED